MPQAQSRTKIIDNLIFGALVLFLLTLTNSIFLNQLGYYSALLLILLKFFITKERPFNKTGLEYFFLAFIAAEIISTIMSLNQAQSFNNLLKRVLLIPIVYVVIASVNDFKKLKLAFKVFIGAALLGMLIYLYFAFEYYINNLFHIRQSGPSLFQYPITASEIMSFVFVFLFAFLINEKMTLKNKIFLLLLFTIASLALFSTYKRTGWMGAGAGLFTVLLLKRMWKVLITIALILIALVIFQKRTSIVQIMELKGNQLISSKTFSTDGRASDIYADSTHFYIADFNNGIVDQKNRTVKKFNSPVQSIDKLNDSTFICNLLDTRFIKVQENGDSLIQKASFASPGNTYNYQIYNDYLYVLDNDSGLTIFDAGISEKMIARKPDIKYASRLYVDSNYSAFYYPDNKVEIYNQNQGLPDRLIWQKHPDKSITGLFLKDNKLIISDKNELNIFLLKGDSVYSYAKSSEVKNLYQVIPSNKNYYGLSLSGELYSFSSEQQFTSDKVGSIDFIPNNISIFDNKFYLAFHKISRLGSIFDLYNPSNYNRFSLWRAGWNIFKDYPLFGVGDTDLAFLYSKYKQESDKEIQGHMHNNFIHILVILGAFGFLIVMALLLKIFLTHLKIFNELNQIPFASSVALGSAASFVAFLVSGLTEWNFGDHEIITMVWFILGLNLSFYFVLSNKKGEIKLNNK